MFKTLLKHEHNDPLFYLNEKIIIHTFLKCLMIIGFVYSFVQFNLRIYKYK